MDGAIVPRSDANAARWRIIIRGATRGVNRLSQPLAFVRVELREFEFVLSRRGEVISFGDDRGSWMVVAYKLKLNNVIGPGWRSEICRDVYGGGKYTCNLLACGWCLEDGGLQSISWITDREGPTRGTAYAANVTESISRKCTCQMTAESY